MKVWLAEIVLDGQCQAITKEVVQLRVQRTVFKVMQGLHSMNQDALDVMLLVKYLVLVQHHMNL